MTSKCPICNSKTSYLFTSKHNREVLQCYNDKCKHLFTPPILAKQGVHHRPDDIENESNKSLKLYGERNKRLLHLLLGHLPEKKSAQLVFLDFGAGDAHISRTFKDTLGDKVEIYCVEEEENCKPLYSKHGLIQLEKIEDMNTKADLIYVIEVIEHVDNPVAVLNILGEVLGEGGKILISTPPGHIDEQKTNAYDNPTHLHFFTPLSLNLALTKAGLLPIEYRHFPEMYLNQASNIKRAMQWVYRCLRKLYYKKSNSSMNMPSSSGGRAYPYHLVGLSNHAIKTEHAVSVDVK